MKLEEFLTDKPEFFLSKKNKSYTLRIPNLDDRARFRQWLGNEQRINEVFKNLEWDVIAKLVYRILEDKNDFIAREEERINDDGVKIKCLITGPALLMESVYNIEEATKMLAALINALRMGDPLVNDFVKELSDEELQKKSPTLNQIGQSSLTASPQNMDIPQANSAP